MRERTPRSFRRVCTAAAAVAAAGSAVLALVAPPAGAQEPAGPSTADPPQFAVQPSGPNGPGGRDYFVYDLAPGETFGDTVGVSNLGDAPITFAVYATDAFNTADGAGFALLKEEEEPVDLGTWVQLAATEYTIQPGQRADIPFVLTVPRNAAPGDHAGAIVAQPLIAGPGPQDGDFNFDLRLRIGARVYVRVAGEAQPSVRVEGLALRHSQGLGLTSGEHRLEYVVRNDGNLRLNPTVRVRIEGPFGITVRELDERQLPELLPGGAITMAETVTGLPLAGRLRAVVEVSAEGTQSSAGVTTWAVPWLAVAIVAVVAATLWWRRRRRRGSRSPAPPTVERRQPVHA